MLQEGVRLMVVGMTTVFGFLGILVVAMHVNRAVARLVGPSAPERIEPTPSGNDSEIAVVLAALAAHRGESR